MKIIVLKCPNCGQNIEGITDLSKVKFCTNCGSKVEINNYIHIENESKLNNIEEQLRNIEDIKRAKAEYKRKTPIWFFKVILTYVLTAAILFITCESAYTDKEVIPMILALLADAAFFIYPCIFTPKRPLPPKGAEGLSKVNQVVTALTLLAVGSIAVFTSLFIGLE